jgi:hypothetical protein
MTGYINLDTIFNWRNCSEIVEKLQDFGVIPKDREIKCSQPFCNGNFKVMNDSTVSDGVRWSCDGTVRYPKTKAVKCKKRYLILLYLQYLLIYILTFAFCILGFPFVTTRSSTNPIYLYGKLLHFATFGLKSVPSSSS